MKHLVHILTLLFIVSWLMWLGARIDALEHPKKLRAVSETVKCYRQYAASWDKLLPPETCNASGH